MQVAQLDILEKAHFDKEQARAILNVVEIAVKEHEDSAATKADVHRLELKMEQVKSELLKWLVGMIFGQAALLWYIIKGSAL